MFNFFKKKDKDYFKDFAVQYNIKRDEDGRIIITSCNKSAKEIFRAYNSGVYPRAVIDGVNYVLTNVERNIDDGTYYFCYRSVMLSKNVMKVFDFPVCHSKDDSDIYIEREPKALVFEGK